MLPAQQDVDVFHPPAHESDINGDGDDIFYTDRSSSVTSIVRARLICRWLRRLLKDPFQVDLLILLPLATATAA